MAETWKVQLNDEETHGGGVYCEGSITTACTNNTGKFNFASPSTGVNNYTITYTNGTQTATTSFTVNAGDCVKCDCDKIEFTATEVNGQGGDGVQLGTFRVTSEFCKNAFTIKASKISDAIKEIRISGNQVLGKVDANPGAPRNLKFNLLINNNTCLQTTTQKTGCNCNSITHTNGSITSFDKNGYTGSVATYSVTNGCDISKVGIQGDSVYSLATEGNSHIVKATVTKNETGAQRSYTYKLTYNGTACEGKGRTISQPMACDCSSFEFDTEGGTIYISASGGCDTNLGTIKGTTCGGSYQYVSHTTTNNNFGYDPVIGYNNGYLKGKLGQNNGNPESSPSQKHCTVTVTVKASDGTNCTSDPFTIVQYASLTDNDSAMEGGDDCSIHPLHIDGSGIRGGNDDNFLRSQTALSVQADEPYAGGGVAPLNVKDSEGETISAYVTGITYDISVTDGSVIFNLRENPSTTDIRYAALYLRNNNYSGSGIYQHYGWIVAKQARKGYKWDKINGKWTEIPDV